jgi:hypothetical protein
VPADGTPSFAAQTGDDAASEQSRKVAAAGIAQLNRKHFKLLMLNELI